MLKMAECRCEIPQVLTQRSNFPSGFWVSYVSQQGSYVKNILGTSEYIKKVAMPIQKKKGQKLMSNPWRTNNLSKG